MVPTAKQEVLHSGKSGMEVLSGVAPTLYFSLLFTALAVVLWSYPWRAAFSGPLSAFPVVLAAVSLLVTWHYILAYFADQSQEFGCVEPFKQSPWMGLELFFCNTKAYLQSSNLFVRTYLLVVNPAQGWFWSSDLLGVVIPICFFIHQSEHLPDVVRISYLLIGFLCAISVMFSLFIGEWLLTPGVAGNITPKSSVDSIHLICSVIAAISIVLLPVTAGFPDLFAFVVALILLHFILLVPSLVKTGFRSISTKEIYLFFALATLLIRVQALFSIYIADGSFTTKSLVEALFGNLCQSSIGFDGILCSIGLAFLIWKNSHISNAIFHTVISLVFSPGFSFSSYLYLNESVPTRPIQVPLSKQQ